jgi:hypothetical protein
VLADVRQGLGSSAAVNTRKVDQQTANATGAHISAKVILWRVTAGMAHDSADRAWREAATDRGGCPGARQVEQTRRPCALR